MSRPLMFYGGKLMTPTEAIEYIHSRLTFGIHPGMERIRALCAALGNPQDELRFIHVAGTNGKGSTSTMISCMLSAAGYRTGLFTSPYVIDFRERMQIDGEMIPPEELASTVERVKLACDELDKRGIVATEFETLTAAAFLWYKERKCDVVVLEVGLGGLLDSTNIIKTPLVSVITSISMDHTAILGNTIAEIAAQKCGIIKPRGVTVMYPEQSADARRVIEETAQREKNKLAVPDMTACRVVDETIRGTDIIYGSLNLRIPFAGDHMIKNALTAVTAVRECGLNVSGEAIEQGMKNAVMPARMELIGENIILDGGHNEGCASALKAFLERFTSGRRVAVCALMGDKDCDTYLRLTAPLFEKMYLTAPDNPRSMNPEALSKLANKYCADCTPVSDPTEACRMAINDIKQNGGTFVTCGSFYLAGEVRGYLLENKNI